MKGKATSQDLLNEREQEILQRLSTGLSDQQIADELFLSLNTVKWYNRQIYSKLGVKSRTQAVAYAKSLVCSSMASRRHRRQDPGLRLPYRPCCLSDATRSSWAAKRCLPACDASCRQVRQRPSHSRRPSAAWAGLAKHRWPSNMPIAMLRTIRRSSGCGPIAATPWWQAFWRSPPCCACPSETSRISSVVMAAVKGWLSQNTNWLLILDNADDLALLPEFLPSPLSGHLLLTTRAQALGGLAGRIELETLDLDDAVLLLLRRGGCSPWMLRLPRPSLPIGRRRCSSLRNSGACPWRWTRRGRTWKRPAAASRSTWSSTEAIGPTCCVTAGGWAWTIPTRSPPPGRSRLP